jgi:hypothetical protein
MSGTFAVDAAATFTYVMFVNSMPKLKYGAATPTQETNAAGVPKWAVDLTVTFTPTLPGMAPESEVLTVTITDSVQPGQGLNPGAPVQLEGLRIGHNPPELTENKKIRGGKLWYNATGLKPLGAAQSSRRESGS